MNATFKLVAIARDGHDMGIEFRTEELDNVIRVTVPAEATRGREINLIRIESSLTTRKVGDAGNMIFPTGMGDGVAQCNFDEKDDAMYRSRIACMATAGICATPDAVMLLCRSASALRPIRRSPRQQIALRFVSVWDGSLSPPPSVIRLLKTSRQCWWLVPWRSSTRSWTV